MRYDKLALVLALTPLARPAHAQSNIDAINKHAWGENIGWTNWRDANGAVQGVAVGATVLSGFAWGEDIGWVNFSGGAMAAPAQPARIQCDGRLTGYVWAENAGWINLSAVDAGKFVAIEPAAVPLACDVNHDGAADGEDIAAFVDLLFVGGADWRDVCAGDVEDPPDGGIDADDLAALVACLLAG